ncbi:MAG: hypothetical protein NTX79_04810 [Candidatus Micrarchaeota archaeon]|nr:hypothetical protein [Candidatus Micrarchaeota archaeon]
MEEHLDCAFMMKLMRHIYPELFQGNTFCNSMTTPPADTAMARALRIRKAMAYMEKHLEGRVPCKSSLQVLLDEARLAGELQSPIYPNYKGKVRKSFRYYYLTFISALMAGIGKEEGAMPLLEKALHDDSASVSACAAAALGSLRRQESYGRILHVLKKRLSGAKEEPVWQSDAPVDNILPLATALLRTAPRHLERKALGAAFDAVAEACKLAERKQFMRIFTHSYNYKFYYSDQAGFSDADGKGKKPRNRRSPSAESFTKEYRQLSSDMFWAQCSRLLASNRQFVSYLLSIMRDSRAPSNEQDAALLFLSCARLKDGALQGEIISAIRGRMFESVGNHSKKSSAPEAVLLAEIIMGRCGNLAAKPVLSDMVVFAPHTMEKYASEAKGLLEAKVERDRIMKAHPDYDLWIKEMMAFKPQDPNRDGKLVPEIRRRPVIGRQAPRPLLRTG